MSNTDIPMRDVIAMALEAKAVTTQAGLIGEKLDGLTVGQLPNNRFELSKLLSADPSPVPDAFARAGEILTFMREAELIGQAGTTASASQPDADAVAQAVKVQVELPRNIDQLSLREQLELLRDNPERADEILAYIGQQPQVRAALRKSDRLAVVNDGVLNVDETLKYIVRLARDYTQPTELVNEVRPTTLAKAAGTESRPYIHPFTGEPVEGADELGFDFSQLPEELHNALLWARVTEHAAWPTLIDRFAASEEVFADRLVRRWQIIIDAYVAAKADGDEMATTITRFYPKNLMRQLGFETGRGRLPFAGSPGAPEPERDEAWYEQQLRNVALSSIRASGSDVRRENCVITSVSSAGGDVRLRNVIVLGDVSSAGGDISGTIFMPYRASVRTSGGNDRSHSYNRSWKQLYEKAVELGVIQP